MLDDDDELARAEAQFAYAPLARRDRTDDEQRFEHPQRRPCLCATIDGCSLHAQTAVAPEDRVGLERLCRYAVRSSFALQRLSVLPDGKLCYQLKRPFAGQTQLRLDGLQLLRRLVRLIPRPWFNLVRYHGAFAAAAKLRPYLPVPRPPAAQACCGGRSVAPAPHLTRTSAGDRPADDALSAVPGTSAAAPAWPTAHLRATPPLSDDAATNATPARSRRVPWAELLRRVHEVDVLCCPSCHGRLRLIAAISDPSVVRQILAHLGLPTDRPAVALARAPPLQEDLLSHLDAD